MKSEDVARRLAAFVKDHDGKVGGNQLGDFYKLYPGAQAVIIGGAKKFCEAHPALLQFETVPGAPGWIRLVRTAATAPSKRDIAKRLAALISSNGGEMHAGSCLALLYKDCPDAKAAIQDGTAKFCEQHPDLLRYERDSGGGRLLSVQVSRAGGAAGKVEEPGSEPARDEVVVAKLLSDFVAERGGRMQGGEIHEFYKQQPHAKEVVASSGGIRQFCENHPNLLLFHKSHIFLIAMKHPSKPTEGNAVAVLRKFVARRGGELECRNLTDFFTQHTWARVIVDSVGGARALCERHEDKLRFEIRSGSTWICVVNSAAVMQKKAKTELCRYLPNCTRGSICTYAHSQGELRAKPDNDTSDRRSASGAAIGSPAKDTTLDSPRRLEGVVVAQQLREFIHSRGGEVDPSKISEFYAKYPSGQAVVRMSGSLRKFCDEHPSALDFPETERGRPHVIRSVPEDPTTTSASRATGTPSGTAGTFGDSGADRSGQDP